MNMNKFIPKENYFLSSQAIKKVHVENQMDLEGRPIKVLMMFNIIKKAYGRKFVNNIKGSIRKHAYDQTEFQILREMYEMAKIRLREKNASI